MGTNNMTKKIFSVILAGVIAAACMSGCGKSDAAGTKLSGGGVAFEPSTKVTVSQGDMSGNTAPAADLQQDKADAILSDALVGTGCKAIFESMETIDGSDYFVYSVRDSKNNELTQMLAVNAKSGEVVVCESADAQEVSPFSDFKYYDKVSEKSKNISWEGTFDLDTISVRLSPADDNSFEFTINKDGKSVLEGVAYADEDTASWKSEDGKEELKFTMADADTLQLIETGSAGVSGQYTKNK